MVPNGSDISGERRSSVANPLSVYSTASLRSAAAILRVTGKVAPMVPLVFFYNLERGNAELLGSVRASRESTHLVSLLMSITG